MPLILLDSKKSAPVDPSYGEGYLGLFDLNSFGAVYYADQATGDDGNPGTEELPKASYDAAMALCSAGDAVVVGPGSYLSTFYPGTSYCKPSFGAVDGTSVIASHPGQVEIYNNADPSGRDAPMCANTGTDSFPISVFGFILTHDHNGGSNYQKSVFRSGTWHLYNCVLRLSAASPVGRSMNYNNGADHQPIVHNCSFFENGAWASSYSGKNVDIHNSTFNYWPTSRVDHFDNIQVTGYEADWSNVTDNTKGVHGGIYAWPTS